MKSVITNLFRNIYFILFLLSMYFFAELSAYPFTTRPYSGDDITNPEFCNVAGQFDSNTKATVYGDSRMDYMGNIPGLPLYDMDVYLHFPNTPTWNVQNFGLNGETSEGLFKHLDKCLNFTSTKYKIHENIAFHIGGNDFVHSLWVLGVFPWKQKEYVDYAKYNNERIVVKFLKKYRNVLMTGHYPALSMSSNPLVNETVLEPMNKAVIASAEFGYTNYIPGRTAFPGSSVLIAKRAALCSGLALPPDSNIFAPINGREWYTKIATGQFIGTIPSLGIMNLEPRIVKMVNDRSPQFAAAGRKLTHLPLWNCYTFPEVTPDPWVVDPALMVDPIHPNVNGFLIWGTKVGEKMRSLGYDTSTYSVENQTLPSSTEPEGSDPTAVTPPAPPSPNDILIAIAACVYFKVCKR